MKKISKRELFNVKGTQGPGTTWLEIIWQWLFG